MYFRKAKTKAVSARPKFSLRAVLMTGILCVALWSFGLLGSVGSERVLVTEVLEQWNVGAKDRAKLSTYLSYCESEAECGFHAETADSGEFVVKDFPVLFKWFSAPKRPKLDGEISVVSQLSLERLRDLKQGLCAAWKGPISLAVFVRGGQWLRALQNVTEECPQIEWLSVVFGSANDWYPINHLRNVALQQTDSEYVLVIDCDFVTAHRMYSTLRTDTYQQFLRQNLGGSSQPTMLVVPALETASRALWREVSSRHISEQRMRAVFAPVSALPAAGAHLKQFHVEHCGACHAYANYAQWLRSDSHALAYERSVEQKNKHMFEPYTIVRRSKLQRYDARFRGYGKNKIVHTRYLWKCRHYRILVFYRLFVLHFTHEESAERKKWQAHFDNQSQASGKQQMAAFNKRLEQFVISENCSDSTGYIL